MTTETEPRYHSETGRTDVCDCCGERKTGTTHYELDAPIFHECDECKAAHAPAA